MSTTNQLKPRLLMGPGPSDVHPRVLAAMARPTVGHLDPQFTRLLDEIGVMLRKIFKTGNALTLAMSGTGSAGMETCVVNLIEPGDAMLVCIAGVFGQRMKDVAERARARVTAIEVPWGRVFTPAMIRDAIRAHGPFKLVGIVNAETSTGAAQPIPEISAAVHESGALMLVDTVTSLGGMEVDVDGWNIDACYSGTQKCLSCPPGLSPVTFSAAAMAAMDKRTTKVQSWYLDLGMIRRYWGTERLYHHTAPVNMNYALHEALNIVLEEGLEARWQRHRRVHEQLKAGLRELGIGYLSDPDHTLPMLNAVSAPAGVDEAEIRRELLTDYDIEIGGGLGDFKGKAWRIGLMGETARPEKVDRLLGALRTAIEKR